MHIKFSLLYLKCFLLKYNVAFFDLFVSFVHLFIYLFFVVVVFVYLFICLFTKSRPTYQVEKINKVGVCQRLECQRILL